MSTSSNMDRPAQVGMGSAGTDAAASGSVGIVGAGRMGSAFARNLAEDGFRVVVYDIDRSKAESVAGATITASSEWEPLGECGIVISMIPDDVAIRSVASHLAMVLRQGAVHISMSTISPEVAREVSEIHRGLGQEYISAPVLGNPDLAAARGLYVLAAGEDQAVARCMPVLERLGQRVFVLGQRPELANTFKLAGNMLTAATMQSMAEVLVFLRKAGIDTKTAFSVLTGSIFDGKVHKTYGGKIAEERYSPPGMTVSLAVKDLRLALNHAEGLRVPMPIASVVHDRLVAVSARGWSELDWSALGKLAAFSAGL